MARAIELYPMIKYIPLGQQNNTHKILTPMAIYCPIPLMNIGNVQTKAHVIDNQDYVLAMMATADRPARYDLHFPVKFHIYSFY